MDTVIKKNKLYIIAEVGSVHDGSFGNACKLIHLAAKCGANAVKFQTHFGELESLKNASRPAFFKEEDRISYFNRTMFSFSEYKKFILIAKKNKIDFLSSPFSIEAVDFLESLKIKAYKIPSGELTNHPLLERVARTGKKVFLSTGMAKRDEIDNAVKILKKSRELIIMQCTSIYPCPLDKVGLNVIGEIRKKYKTKVGFSDHTTDSVAAIGAVFFGASVIEKHITFSKHMYGSDAKNSMEPKEFKIFCDNIKKASFIYNNPIKKDSFFNFVNIKKIFEKSIVSKINLSKGTKIKMHHLSFKKPGDGISSSKYKQVLGLRLKKDIKKDTKLLFKILKK
jgi:N,N'-diacetyllegionaminate synthase